MEAQTGEKSMILPDDCTFMSTSVFSHSSQNFLSLFFSKVVQGTAQYSGTDNAGHRSIPNSLGFVYTDNSLLPLQHSLCHHSAIKKV